MSIHFLGGTANLEQRKKTMFPEWNSCFDSHLKDGRVVQVCFTFLFCYTFIIVENLILWNNPFFLAINISF